MSHLSGPFTDTWRRRRKLVLPAVLGLVFVTAGPTGTGAAVGSAADTVGARPVTSVAYEKAAPAGEHRPAARSRQEKKPEGCSFTGKVSVSPGIKATPANQKVTTTDTEDKGACVDDKGAEVLTFTAVGQKAEFFGHCKTAVGHGTNTLSLSGAVEGSTETAEVAITWVAHAALSGGVMNIEGSATATSKKLGLTDFPVTFKAVGTYPAGTCKSGDGVAEISITEATIEI